MSPDRQQRDDPPLVEPSGTNLPRSGHEPSSPDFGAPPLGTPPEYAGEVPAASHVLETPQPTSPWSPIPIQPPPPPKRTRRRWFRGRTREGRPRGVSKGLCIAGVVVSAIGLPALGLGAWLRWGPPLWPTPLAGVNIFPVSIAPISAALTDDNALTHLRKLHAAKDAWDRIPDSVRTAWRTHGWAASELPRFEQAWKLCEDDRIHWERAATAPRVVHFEVDRLEELRPMFEHILAMAALECARAERWVREGRWDEADVALARTLEIGGKLSQGGSALQVRVGWAVQDEVLRTLRRVAGAFTDAALLASWQSRLESVPPQTQELAEALRYEAVFLFEVAHRLYALLYGHAHDRGLRARRIAMTTLARLGSTPAQTHRHLMGVTTHWIGSVLPEHRAHADRRALARLRRWVRWVPLLADDPVAACLVRQFLPNLSAMETLAEEMERAVVATRCVLAVRRFELENRRLPSSWSELTSSVPNVAASGSWSIVVSRGHWAVSDGQRTWGPLEFNP